jgi:pimeloyl-ACP methyl ester carboxylesterase
LLNHQFIGNQTSKNLIVFLHEGLGCIEMWKDYPTLVCKQLNCLGLVYDRAGYGKSEGDLSHRAPNYLHQGVDELYNLLKALNLLDKNIILYGHSDGGSIALLFASKYPELIEKIITEAAHVFVEDETLEGIKPAVEAFETGKLEGLKKYHGSRYKTVFYAWVNIWNAPEFRTWNIESELQSITCPQLIIQGANDQYGTLKQVESIKLNTKGETHILIPENCGHAPFKSQKNMVLKAVIKFLKPLR